MAERRPALSLALALAMLAAATPSALGSPVRMRAVAPTTVSVGTPASGGSAETTQVADGRLIVRLKGSLTSDKLTHIYRSADTSAGAVRVVRGDTLSWRAPAGTTPDRFAERLAATGQVAFASPDFIRYPTYTPPDFTTPNDSAYTDANEWGLKSGSTWTELYPHTKSWWIRNVNAVDTSTGGKSAWKRGYTGSNITGKHPLRADGTAVKVAVIDTGVYLTHPDIGTHIEAGSSDVTPLDPSLVNEGVSMSQAEKVMTVSHGTCVAGEIAAAADNGIGTLGVANDTTVRVYKVYGTYISNGRHYTGVSDDDLIAAIEQAADDGCKVINMSLAGPDASYALQDACDYAYSKGCVLVAASGNDGTSQKEYPAACNHVLSVGALGLKGDGTSRKRASFSNYGSTLDLMAPGEFVWGLVQPGFVADSNSEPGYTWWDGTSMASPIVAGGVAWLWRAMPRLSNAAIISLVESSARNLGTAGRDSTYGYGELDMDAAYAKLISEYPLLKNPTASASGGSNARNQHIEWKTVSGYYVTYRVAVDGTTVLSGLTATNATLPHNTPVGPHKVTVTPASSRNWVDGTAVSSVDISPSESVPQVLSLRYHRGALLWTDTETGTVHTDLLSIDGKPAASVSGGTWSTSSLSLGSHTASMTCRDNDVVDSAARSLTFTVREKPTVARVTAADDAGYAAKLSARRTSSNTTSAVLVRSGSWTSAAIAAPLARAFDGPVLISNSKSLPSSTKKELVRLRVTDVTIVGATSSVGTAVGTWLTSHRMRVTRISGSDRYAMSSAVARALARREGGSITGARAVVVGDSAANALSASAVAARKGWPLVFAHATRIDSATRSTLASVGATQTLLVARTSTVSDAAKSQLPGAKRISASSSAGVSAALAAWATSAYPGSFSGERIFLANPSLPGKSLGLGAEAAREGALVLTTGMTMASSVKIYYSAHSEVAVRTRVIGGPKTIANSVVSAIKKIVGAS